MTNFTNRRIWTTASMLLFLGFGIAQAEVDHPLDALEEAEILGAAEAVLATGTVSDTAIFQSIEIREPSKDAVLGWEPGDPIPRAATVFVRDAKKSYRTIVDLTAGTVQPLVEIPASEGQLGLTINELLDFSYLFEDPAFLAALAARGIDDPNPGNVFVTPLTAGSFGLPEESRRIVKAQMYYSEGGSTHLYGKPIEGLQLIIDLDDQEIVELIDTGVLPLPDDVPNFDEATIDAKHGLRDELKPIRITQPEGTNFTIDGNVITWQKWKFHVRFERRSGTVISLATYDGRSVLYQGALSEVFVPYQDPDVNWYYRTYMDAGEFGFGVLASPLFAGLDVPENAVLLDGLISAAIPVPGLPVLPLLQENVIGVYERVTGNAEWRHFELFAPGGPVYEGRAEVELVVRMAAQVGNYDYIVDWIFTQSGRIRVGVSLTGIDIPKVVNSTTIDESGAAADTAHGTLFAPNLVATFHSHYFNFRLDLDVDGRDNRFVLGHLERQKTPGSSRKGVWVLKDELLATEEEGQVKHHGVWRVAHADKKNARGYATSYVLESHGDSHRLLERRDFRRARFLDKPIWVTAHHPDEIYASGDTPNQNPGAPGLPRYVDDNQAIVDTDIVLWHTLSVHHVTAAEDFPVLTREHATFELRPLNFFNYNPSIDLRRAPFEVEAQP
jgi:primary-amine oxidase